MFSTLGNIISVSMLYTTIIYIQLARYCPYHSGFTDFAEFYLDKVTYPKSNYIASSPVPNLDQLHLSYCYYHYCFLSIISIYHYIDWRTFSSYIGCSSLLEILLQFLRSTVFYYLGIIFIKTFSDFAEFFIDKFLYLGSKDILPPNRYKQLLTSPFITSK